MSKSIAIIGGGLGGLSSAIRLARMGFKVKLFENNETVGGKMNEIRLGSCRFDSGPSLITMPFVIDELFEFAGYQRRSFLEFQPIEPICRYFFHDGTIFDASSDRKLMSEHIGQLTAGDIKAFEKFFNYSKRIYDRTADIFLFSPVHELKHMLKWKYLPTLLKFYQIDPFRTVNKAVRSFFTDERLIQIFNRYSTYNGSNPFRAPATLNIIPYVENGLGGFYIMGGIYRLVEALQTIAKQLGVEIFLSSHVEKIFSNKNVVQGILVNGERVNADYVICNADVVTSYNDLIDGYPQIRKRMNKLEPSLSGLVFFWGINERHVLLKHHNILFSADYEKEFKQIFDDLKAPDNPTIYIAITSKKDKNHAPKDWENWFVLLNMPYLHQQQNWKVIAEKMKNIVITRLLEIGIDIRSKIREEKIMSPEDFYTLYKSNKGSIYGISSNSPAMAFKRPANRDRNIKGLYFASGSVHPGGGVPLVMLSGKLTAELILENEH
ncbi:phytoene desaturase [candidate division KSB1 bacterium]|nr:phytoene desaturase [candidate division KSB1 bacterium]